MPNDMNEAAKTASKLSDVVVVNGDAFEDAIVFLHPGMGAARSWGRFAPMLCARLGRTGLIYTREEYESDGDGYILREDFFDRQAETLEYILGEYGIKRALLVGSSDGATIALTHNMRFPDRVQAIVSIAAHVMIDAQMLRALDRLKDQTSADPTPEWLTQLHGARGKKLADAWISTWRSFMNKNWSIEHRLAGVQRPVLALQGTKDENGLPIQINALRTFIPRCSSKMLPGLGHFPFKEEPEALVEIIDAFLKTE